MGPRALTSLLRVIRIVGGRRAREAVREARGQSGPQAMPESGPDSRGPRHLRRARRRSRAWGGGQGPAPRHLPSCPEPSTDPGQPPTPRRHRLTPTAHLTRGDVAILFSRGLANSAISAGRGAMRAQSIRWHSWVIKRQKFPGDVRVHRRLGPRGQATCQTSISQRHLAMTRDIRCLFARKLAVTLLRLACNPACAPRAASQPRRGPRPARDPAHLSRRRLASVSVTV